MQFAFCLITATAKDDKVKGIRSLVTYLNEKGIRNLFIFSMLAFAVSTIGLLYYHYSLLIVSFLLIPVLSLLHCIIFKKFFRPGLLFSHWMA